MNARDGARNVRTDSSFDGNRPTSPRTPPVFLPFLIQDVPIAPCAYRAARKTTSDGVRGITGVTILTDDLESARAAYGKLFAGPVCRARS